MKYIVSACIITVLITLIFVLRKIAVNLKHDGLAADIVAKYKRRLFVVLGIGCMGLILFIYWFGFDFADPLHLNYLLLIFFLVDKINKELTFDVCGKTEEERLMEEHKDFVEAKGKASRETIEKYEKQL